MDPSIPTQQVKNEGTVTQPNLQQQPVGEIPHSGSKFKLILLIIILLILVGGGAYYLGANKNDLVKKQTTPTIIQSSPMPTLDPTVNWATYTDAINKFTFKYPSNWTTKNISAVESELDVPATPCIPAGTCGGTPNGPVVISILDNSKNLPLHDIALQEWLYKQWTDHSIGINIAEKESRLKNFSVQQIIEVSESMLDPTIQISSFYRVNLMGACGGDLAFIGKKSKVIEINSNCIDPNEESMLIRSFKFTDQNQADPTASWKTYNNIKLGYSFKYPGEWKNCPNGFGGGQTDSTIYLCASPVSTSSEFWDYAWTSFVDNPQNLSFQQLLTQNLPINLKNNFKYTTMAISNNSAYVTRTLPGRSESENVFFKLPNNGYVGISFQPTDSVSGFLETYPGYKIFQQILSTFKFTN